MIKVGVYLKVVGKNCVYVVCILFWSVLLMVEIRIFNDVFYL